MKILITAVTVMLLLGAGSVFAQETPTPPVLEPVGSYGCEAALDESVLLCPATTTTNEHGSFAEVALYARNSAGDWVQLTVCDNLAVRCELMDLRADGLVQGGAVGVVLDTK